MLETILLCTACSRAENKGFASSSSCSMCTLPSGAGSTPAVITTPSMMSRKKGNGGAQTGLRSANKQPVVMQSLTLQPSAFRPAAQTFPNVMKTTMRWAWAGALATQAGASTVQVFRLNSLYDPDFTGAGSQPKYFDTLCAASGGTAPYSYYRVRRTHFRACFVNPNSTAATSSYGFCQVYTVNPMSTTAAFQDFFENVNLRTGILTANGNNNSVFNVEGSVDHAALWAVKDWEDNEDFQAPYNSNPAAVTYLQVGVRAQDDTTVATMRVIVQLVYEVEMFSLNNAGLSAVRVTDVGSSESKSARPTSDLVPSRGAVQSNCENKTGVCPCCERKHTG